MEALVAILAADRDTTLRELLADTGGMPENVVEVLVGEAFSRLDGLSQQVMQALAIYGSPVPPVAVDYLLQPFQPAIDSTSVLSRLVNMSFVRRDAGHYYLHQVDRDYAMQRVPVGDPSDRDAEPLLFTQYALRHRGADYFEQTRTPRETWRDLNDLAPQLAEFELRCQTAQYDTAAQVLLEIDVHYLILWGHYRLVLELHHRLQGHLTEPLTESATKGRLGVCYEALGETGRAIELHDQSLAINREIGNRQGESAALGNLGSCYYVLGETRRAIDLHDQALTINREIGDRQGESADLGNLGSCYYVLGETRRAIDLHEQALTIDREIGNRQGESATSATSASATAAWGRPAARSNSTSKPSRSTARSATAKAKAPTSATSATATTLGETRRAIELHDQALAIDREIGDRQGESADLVNLGDCYADLGLAAGGSYYEQAIQIADETDFAPAQSEGRVSLATVQLCAGELDAALQTVQAAPATIHPLRRSWR